MNIGHLFELHHLAVKKGKNYPKKRFIYNQIKAALRKGEKCFIGIAGPRGVGKTVLLQQLSSETPDSLYVSLDTVENTLDLFELAKILDQKYKIRLLLLDEIHFSKNYESALKKIYDFLNIKVIFTSSVSVSIHEATVDLSRRVKLIKLYPFSFREYLFFTSDVLLPPLSVEDLLNQNWKPQYLKYEYMFENYLKGGLLPFSLENPDIMPLLKNILEKIIKSDLPTVAPLKLEELYHIEKVLNFIGKSHVEGINYSSVSRNVGITKYKAEQYLSLLERSFVVNQIFPYGTSVVREPKILMNLPYRLLFKNFDEAIGPIREDFLVETLKMVGYEFYYLKSKRGEKVPDYLVKFKDATGKQKEVVVEVGGKGKGRTQFKGFSAKKKLVFVQPATELQKGRIPLFMAGFLV